MLYATVNFKEASKEVGKGFINIGVAFIIFALIQPFVKGEINTKLFLIAVFGFFISILIGALLVAFGGEKDDT